MLHVLTVMPAKNYLGNYAVKVHNFNRYIPLKVPILAQSFLHSIVLADFDW